MIYEDIIDMSIDYIRLETIANIFGVCFVLYITHIFEPTLIGIALMFGIGNAFDSIVSGGTYWYLMKKVYKL